MCRNQKLQRKFRCEYILLSKLQNQQAATAEVLKRRMKRKKRCKLEISKVAGNDEAQMTKEEYEVRWEGIGCDGKSQTTYGSDLKL